MIILTPYYKQKMKIILLHPIQTLYTLPLIKLYVKLLKTEVTHLGTQSPISWTVLLKKKSNRLLMNVIETLPRI